MKVLFVCLGNICRSPAAEGVLRHQLVRAGMADQVQVASRGTGGWHQGELPDHRMRAAALSRGLGLSSRARQLRVEDLREFDLIYGMDRQNVENILSLDGSAEVGAKVRLFARDLVRRQPPVADVPDPYYDGPEAFEHVLDLLEEGCATLVEKLSQEFPGTQA